MIIIFWFFFKGKLNLRIKIYFEVSVVFFLIVNISVCYVRLVVSNCMCLICKLCFYICVKFLNIIMNNLIKILIFI